VGYKPSSGLFSRAGCLPLSDTLDVLGPIARTVADARLFAQSLARPDPDDAATLAVPPTVFTGVRRPGARSPGPIAVLDPQAWPTPLSDEALETWRQGQERLARAGFIPTPWEPPASLSFRRMANDNSLVLAYEAYRHYGPLAADAGQPLWEVVRARIAGGSQITEAEYQAALRRRRADMAAFAEAMQPKDALLMPACDQAAQALDEADTRHAGLGALLRPANFLGAPAIALPSGFDKAGLPLSVQLIAPAGRDAALLDCAAALEPILGCDRRRPDMSAWGL
jgi:aspartyl-tRNA(Asn)/glutamyl-tRNA(Gln) amidotransferase subunit A